MTIDGTKLEKVLKSLLQAHIKLHLKGKVFKEGKLLLFRQIHYHLELIIENLKGETKKFEIPIPFNVEEWNDENLVYFDYRLQALARGNTALLEMLQSLPRLSNSKFYNTIIEIEIENT